MSEDDELAQIKKKKLDELMKRQHDAVTPKRQIVIEVFTSPTCPHCPTAVAMAKEVASQTQGVQAFEISTGTPQGFAKAALYGVKAVPTVFIDHKCAFVGAPPSVEALRKALKS
ncbi:MAG: thioredoxin family protein [Candidatus Methanoperedens sp.]|uniref:thioredoxin family protein n=1 Tax=Candidatus Methanoperedens sp. BLZ2 TaxID=2035255 RepID=UPI000BE380D9|nr:thioredoxin family protein [Candidatus Methanoperedens sp. BLZ2]KAB2944429.1 MAG: glutaredoxin [Candidatus Methanoperedens sp.]MBZ0174929.1 thioredoxin family protein [Candidatus Methanoperedens nitroreducens]MCX9079762.1 thioredoxin family protein [Candidatus Methanoperedens sp.]